MTIPIHFELDTRYTDDGRWRFVLRLWAGDVDVRNTPPRRTMESVSYATSRTCYLAGLARARTLIHNLQGN